MANKALPTFSEIRHSLTQIINSMQRYPENDSFVAFLQEESAIEFFLNLILPFLQIALQARAKYGKDLLKEQEWIKKLQMLAASESIFLDSASNEHYTTPEPTIHDETCATQDTASLVTQETWTPEPAIQDDASATQVAEYPTSEDTSAIQDTSITQGSLALGPAIQNDASATRDASLVQDNADLDDVSAVQDTLIAPGRSALESTIQGDSSVIQAASSVEECPTPDGTSAIQDTLIPSEGRTRKPTIRDAILEDLTTQSASFPLWASDPTAFWESSTRALRLTEPTLGERLKAFYEHAAGQQPEAHVHTFQRRFDSVIAYHRFRRATVAPHNISLARVRKFLGEVGLPADQATKYMGLLSAGRRRLKFCHLLSKDDAGFQGFQGFFHDDVHFNDIDYGLLFLNLHDRIFESKITFWQEKFKKAVGELKSTNILALSDKYGAKLAAKTLLCCRQASIEHQSHKRKAPSDDDAETDGTAASKRLRTGENMEMLIEAITIAASVDEGATASNPTVARLDYGLHTIQPSNGLCQNSGLDHTTLEENCCAENVASLQGGGTGSINDVNHQHDASLWIGDSAWVMEQDFNTNWMSQTWQHFMVSEE